MQFDEVISPNKCLVIAHRGCSANYPENTMVSFENAIEIGADMIELDVTLSEDGKVVVIHDDTLDRTTNSGGSVIRKKWDTLKKLDAGSWFAPKFCSERIPCLKEVLDLVKDRIPINIEIKHLPDTLIQKTLVTNVIKDVKDLNLFSQTLISSFSSNTLRITKKNEPLFSLGLLQDGLVRGEEIIKFCNSLGAGFLHLEDKCVNKAIIKYFLKNGIKVMVYTVNTSGRFKQLRDWGCVGVFSDNPAKFIKLPG